MLDAKLRVTSGQGVRQRVQWHNLPRASSAIKPSTKQTALPGLRPSSSDSLDAHVSGGAPRAPHAGPSRTRKLQSTANTRWTGSTVAEGHITLQWDRGVNHTASLARAGGRRTVAEATAAPAQLRLHCMTALGREVLVASFDLNKLWAGRKTSNGWQGSLGEVLSGGRGSAAQSAPETRMLFEDEQLKVFCVPASGGTCRTAAAACSLLVGVWRHAAAAGSAAGNAGLGLLLRDVAFCRVLLPHSALLQAALAEERLFYAGKRRHTTDPRSDSSSIKPQAPRSVAGALSRLLPAEWHSWALLGPAKQCGDTRTGLSQAPVPTVATPAGHASDKAPKCTGPMPQPGAAAPPPSRLRAPKAGRRAAHGAHQSSTQRQQAHSAGSSSGSGGPRPAARGEGVHFGSVRPGIARDVPIWAQDLDAVAAACSRVSCLGKPVVAARPPKAGAQAPPPAWLCPEPPAAKASEVRGPNLAALPEFAVHVCFRGLHSSQPRSSLVQRGAGKTLGSKAQAFSWVGDERQAGEDRAGTGLKAGDASVWDAGRSSTVVHVSRQLPHVLCQGGRAGEDEHTARLEATLQQAVHASSFNSRQGASRQQALAGRPAWDSGGDTPPQDMDEGGWTFDSQASTGEGRDSYMQQAQTVIGGSAVSAASRRAELEATLIGRGSLRPTPHHSIGRGGTSHAQASAVLSCIGATGDMQHGALGSDVASSFHSSSALGELAQWAVHPWPPSLAWPTTGAGATAAYAAMQHTSANSLLAEIMVYTPLGKVCFVGAQVVACDVLGEEETGQEVFHLRCSFQARSAPGSTPYCIQLEASVMRRGVAEGRPAWAVRSCDLHLPPQVAAAWKAML